MPESKPFSEQLSEWLKKSKDKSLVGLINVFEEKAFAIIFLVLMALPALPIPTGGLTHITEILTVIGALQLIIGRRTIWLPKWSTRKVNVGKMMTGKGGQKFISIIKWFERYSKRRLSYILAQRLTLSLLGVVVLLYTVAAFIAPPFSGLDTLPSLGVVVLSLGLILEDAVIVLTGVVVGASGIGIELIAGDALYRGITHFF